MFCIALYIAQGCTYIYPAWLLCMMDELLYALYVLCMLCTLLSFHVRIYIYIYIYIYGFRFRGRSWARLVEGGDNSGWEVRVKGGLSPRPDNGRINSSPITAVSPIIKLRQGVTHTITIPGERQVEWEGSLLAWIDRTSPTCRDISY